MRIICCLYRRRFNKTQNNFKQYRMVKVLEISGKIAEDKMKAMLNIYRVKFNNQHDRSYDIFNIIWSKLTSFHLYPVKNVLKYLI